MIYMNTTPRPTYKQITEAIRAAYGYRDSLIQQSRELQRNGRTQRAEQLRKEARETTALIAALKTQRDA